MKDTGMLSGSLLVRSSADGAAATIESSAAMATVARMMEIQGFRLVLVPIDGGCIELKAWERLRRERVYTLAF
jgi:hypothetical protein